MHGFRNALVTTRRIGAPPPNAGAKHPSDSLLRVMLPFGSNPDFRAGYINQWGHIRFGKVLEELDFFAGENLQHIG